jgi:hypothetical protein
VPASHNWKRAAEGIALTPTHIWTSGAILDRYDLTVLLDNQAFGFTITIGPDGSI